MYIFIYLFIIYIYSYQTGHIHRSCPLLMLMSDAHAHGRAALRTRPSLTFMACDHERTCLRTYHECKDDVTPVHGHGLSNANIEYTCEDMCIYI